MENKGILLVNKPIGYSTFDVIRDFKRATSFKGKVGHAGTLDVFADGLVILMVNTTKSFAKFQELEKEYQASLKLGSSSTTLDIEGDITLQNDPPKPSKEQIIEALTQHLGTQEQSIPSFSAAKFEGQPLYKHALKGNLITNKSKQVTIHSLQLIAYKHPLVTFTVTCSSGTYIRQLSRDIFKDLGIESFLFGLTRTKIGDYHLKDAISIKELANWQKKLVNIDS